VVAVFPVGGFYHLRSLRSIAAKILSLTSWVHPDERSNPMFDYPRNQSQPVHAGGFGFLLRPLFERELTDKLHDAFFDDIGFNADP